VIQYAKKPKMPSLLIPSKGEYDLVKTIKKRIAILHYDKFITCSYEKMRTDFLRLEEHKSFFMALEACTEPATTVEDTYYRGFN
jgi:hypothetical protein